MHPDSSQTYSQPQGQVNGQVQGYGGNPQPGTAVTPDGMNGRSFPTDPNRPLPTHPYPVPVTDPNGAVRVDLKRNPAMLGIVPDEKPGETGLKQTGNLMSSTLLC